MKTHKNLLNHLIYLAFGTLFFSNIACFDAFMTPADDPSPRLAPPRIAVLSSICYGEGEMLTVYNPFVNDLNYYDTKAYRVQWVNNGALQFEGATTPCVCGSTFKVVVTRLEDNVSSSLFYTTVNCKGPVDR